MRNPKAFRPGKGGRGNISTDAAGNGVKEERIRGSRVPDAVLGQVFFRELIELILMTPEQGGESPVHR